MRKLYDEFFYVPKQGKIREKVMLTRVVIIVVIMVLCLVAMSFTAYAYFSDIYTSGISTIKAASFDIEVSVINEDSASVDVLINGDAYEADLMGGMTYEITLKRTEDSTAKTGFVVIYAENGDNVYHSQQLSSEIEGQPNSITFSVTSNADTKVSFRPYWGTSSLYGDEDNELYITDGRTVELFIKVDENLLPTEETPASEEESKVIDESMDTESSVAEESSASEESAIEEESSEPENSEEESTVSTEESSQPEESTVPIDESEPMDDNSVDETDEAEDISESIESEAEISSEVSDEEIDTSEQSQPDNDDIIDSVEVSE